MKARCLLLWGFSALLLTACGKPGAPQPPSLQLPAPPQDLTVTRKGNLVRLAWTPPAQTTDGQNIRARFAGTTHVCRTTDSSSMLTCQWSLANFPAGIPPSPPPGEKKAPALPKLEYTDKLPEELQRQNPTGFAEYAVEVTNAQGRSAGLSNQVRVPMAPTLAPPSRLEQRVTSEGIAISFACPAPSSHIHGISYAAHVYRRDPSGTVADVGSQSIRPQIPTMPAIGAEQCTVTDTNFEWEKTYSYWVAMVTRVNRGGQELARVEGNDSPAIPVFAHDVFPPAVPEGLEAVASGVGQKPYIDLTWTPNSELDLDGYNVFRQEPGTTKWVKLNPEPLKNPAFRDERVVAGQTYVYAVSALDVRRNHSQRSTPATETVP